jgi:hypothetical protein
MVSMARATTSPSELAIAPNNDLHRQKTTMAASSRALVLVRDMR